jgi:hypothetical protein
MLKVESYEVISGLKHTTLSSSVTCWAYDFNGTDLKRTAYQFLVKKFDEPMDIKDLPCYPIEWYPGGAEEVRYLRQKLQSRGQRFRELCTSTRGSDSRFAYDDLAMTDDRDLEDILSEVRQARIYPICKGFPDLLLEIVYERKSPDSPLFKKIYCKLDRGWMLQKLTICSVLEI